MANQVELSPEQLAGIDYLIAKKQANSPVIADCWIDCAVKVVQVVCPVAVAAIAAAATADKSALSTADPVNTLQNLSLEQLMAIRDNARK